MGLALNKSRAYVELHLQVSLPLQQASLAGMGKTCNAGEHHPSSRLWQREQASLTVCMMLCVGVDVDDWRE